MRVSAKDYVLKFVSPMVSAAPAFSRVPGT